MLRFLSVTASKHMLISFVGIVTLNQKANAMFVFYTANRPSTQGGRGSSGNEMKELLVTNTLPFPTMTLKFRLRCFQ